MTPNPSVTDEQRRKSRMTDIIERAEAALQQLRLVPRQPASPQLIIRELITELKAARAENERRTR